ncbi:MAG: serpin family protein [bacterium]|nr:serpin family protein [bacterium]
MTYDLPTLARAYNGFGLRLLSHLQKQFPLQNTFISPMSIAMALAMTYNGARGETERAMAETLGVPGMSRHTLNQLNQTVLENLANADNSVDLTIANSLWARHDIPFVPAFLSAVRAAYRAELANVNFLAPDTCPRINRWVEQATRNRITDLIQPADLNEETILILINAIYFKGKWERPFDPAATQELPFTCANGAVKQHPFMAQSARFHYHQDHQVQIVRLPYGKGRLSMRVILPAPGVRITDILATLDEARWRAWNDALQSREGTVKLPRFKMEYAAELTAPLSALGMAIAFDRQRADFRDMATIRERICISAVRHKAFIEVNEEGTEAAAATGVVMARVTAIMPTERFMMICDRPFLYAICDDETGLLLFLGTVQQL